MFSVFSFKEYWSTIQLYNYVTNCTCLNFVQKFHPWHPSLFKRNLSLFSISQTYNFPPHFFIRITRLYTILYCLLPSLLLLVLGCVETKCHFYSSCVERPNGQAACLCNEKCTLKFEPVCGSNGKTYINECLMRADACKQRKSFVVLQKGACSKSCLSSCLFVWFFPLLLPLYGHALIWIFWFSRLREQTCLPVLGWLEVTKQSYIDCYHANHYSLCSLFL